MCGAFIWSAFPYCFIHGYRDQFKTCQTQGKLMITSLIQANPSNNQYPARQAKKRKNSNQLIALLNSGHYFISLFQNQTPTTMMWQKGRD